MGVELYAPVDRKVDVVVEIFIQFSSNQLLQFGNIFRILFDVNRDFAFFVLTGLVVQCNTVLDGDVLENVIKVRLGYLEVFPRMFFPIRPHTSRTTG